MIKFLKKHWRSRWERFYSNSHFHLIIDVFGICIIIIFAVLLIYSYVYKNNLSLIPWYSNSHQVIDLNNPPLELDFSTEEKVFKSGEGILIKIKYKNNGLIIIKNVKFNFLSQNANFSISKIEKAGDNLNADNISFNGSELVINSIESAEAGEIDCKIYVKNLKPSDRVLSLGAQSEYSLGGQLIKKNNDLAELVLTAELTVNSVVYYHSPQGDQLGAGPLPPVQDIPTNYWVFWDVKNNGDFKDFIMRAKLPKNVELGGGRSLLAGDLKYNSVTRQIIWTVPEIKNDSGNYRAGFEIQLIPSASDFGNIPTLISGINYYAIDLVSGEEFTGGFDDLTANLDFDKINHGEGRVVSQ